MLKILGLTSNPFYENESSRKLNSTRNKSNKEKCNESTAKKKSKRKSIITSPQIKNLNTKEALMQWTKIEILTEAKMKNNLELLVI